MACSTRASTSTMAAPCSVSKDPVPAKRRCDELGISAVPTVGERATVLLAKRLDVRSSVVYRVVAVAGNTCGCGDDSQIAPADQDLGVTRPAVILGTGCLSMVAGRSVPSTTHDSRRSVGQFGAASAASRGVIVETIRCAEDFEIAKLAASSRIVRFVRSAVNAIKMRWASEREHGRPC